MSYSIDLYNMMKVMIIIVALYLLHTIYKLIYIPFRERCRYRKYSNIAMTQKYYPVIGDFALVLKYQNDNKFRFKMFYDVVKENKNYDFYSFQQGPHTVINVLSTDALTEFERLVPIKIDRYNQYGKFPVGNIVRGSLGQCETTKEFLMRRKEATKAIGINHISQYIPIMLEIVSEWISTVQKDERIDLSLEITKIVFKIISMILFGTDVDKMKPIPYISPKTGKYVSLTLEEFYTTYPQDEFAGFCDPKGTLFPFLVQYGLAEPYKSNIKNRKALIDELTSFTSKSKDTQSVYKQLEALGVIPKEVIINDIVLLLFAGFDTITHLIISCLFQLKKNPNELRKLKDSLDKLEISQINKSNAFDLKDVYENCDNLNYVIKESLRIDGPAMQCIMYFTKEDMTICGVPFKKGTMIYPNLTIICIQYIYYRMQSIKNYLQIIVMFLFLIKIQI